MKVNTVMWAEICDKYHVLDYIYNESANETVHYKTKDDEDQPSAWNEGQALAGPKNIFWASKKLSHWSKWHNGGPNILWNFKKKKKSSKELM